MIDYTLILRRRFEGSEWALTGDDYDGLVWLSADAKPSKQTLDAMWNEVQQEAHRAKVEQQRQAAYAATSDPLFFKWQRGEGTEQEWLDAVEAIKQQYPY